MMKNREFDDMRKAILKHDLDRVQQLLQTGTHVDIKSEGGNTSLHWSVENDFIKGVAFFLAFGADIEARNSKGLTPLYIAVRKDNLPITTLLIEKGANINIQDSLWAHYTPLHVAKSREMVNLLLANGANPNALDKWSNIPMQVTADSAQGELISRWLSGGENPNHRFANRFGNEETMLFYADSKEAIRALC